MQKNTPIYCFRATWKSENQFDNNRIPERNAKRHIQSPKTENKFFS